MSFQAKGKTALVTGANRGIGKAIVEALLQHGAAKVYASSLSDLTLTYCGKAGLGQLSRSSS